MKVRKHVKARIFHWSHILAAIALVLPLFALCLLGFAWLIEHECFLLFILVSAMLAITSATINFLVRRSRLKSAVNGETIELDPNPEWSASETQLYIQTCKTIQAETQEVIAWQSVPDKSIAIIQQIAVEMGGTKANALDFSVPEGLLLIEKTTSRYRKHIREKIPFTDQVSITHLYWLWRKRKSLSLAWKLADGGRRLARFATNPSGAVIKEVELLMTGGQSQYFSDELSSTLQTLLLEEVAAAAIDLYSGRMRFSERELEQIALATTKLDETRTAQPDHPLRVLFVGQVSVGKSSVINHLINDDHAETDAAPTTAEFTTYRSHIDNVECYYIDSPGITGSDQNVKLLLEEIKHSDMVIWLLRADRPSRAADVALYRAYEGWQQKEPSRRAPPILFALTHIDRIDPRWPFPEHELPKEVQQTIIKAGSVVASDFDTTSITPISNAAPAWNIEALHSVMLDHMLEASMAQRNRKRLSAKKQSGSLFKNTKRGATGIYKGTKTIAKKWLSKNTDKP